MVVSTVGNTAPAATDTQVSETVEDFSYLELSDSDIQTDAADPAVMELSDGVLEITRGGDYYLSGSMKGMLHINAPGRNVHLILDGINIESECGPAIYCENAKSLVITLADVSDNRISDSGCYEGYEDTQACLYSACDLSFNGGGMLSVYGRCKDAVHCRDVIRITGGFYQVKSKKNGFQGNDGVFITRGIFRVSSGKDSFRTTKKGECGRGDMIIIGGDFNTISGRYSFVTSRADLYINNCIIHDRSIYDTFSAGGNAVIQDGCIL